MSTVAQQESLIKESLFHFITKNIPTANISVIDDIALSYVISIIESASQDSCFDIEGFIEFMSAYIPDFANIDEGVVCSWLMELEAEVSQHDESDSNSAHDDSAGSDKISLTLQNISELLPTGTKASRSHSSSESSECSTRRAPMDTEEYSEQVNMLIEMFPNTCTMEVPKSGAEEEQLKKPKKQHCP
ncbi:unnamed protein product [Leptidea sinapis]|uniref:CUE domain-containing protein n=1 Tax=Leptidea sinapis TaxID=189913 RepID=A0A5E4QMH6_9NEOP|nr:unnamed protein product [Leptidea sinapis]